MSLRDLAEAADLPKSTASRLLSALERHGLVHQAGERGKLEPGPAILRFAHRGGVERNLSSSPSPALEAIAEASGETVNLAVPTPYGVDHLAQVDARHFLGAGQWVGRRIDFHCTANGKVFLAFGAAELPPGRAAPAHAGHGRQPRRARRASSSACAATASPPPSTSSRRPGAVAAPVRAPATTSSRRSASPGRRCA